MFRLLLETINQPSDLAKLSIAELESLASEIRSFLVDSVSKTGGHFGANLGVVELTLALHKIYDSPADKIIWDVGHQAYVHKILTGRQGSVSDPCESIKVWLVFRGVTKASTTHLAPVTPVPPFRLVLAWRWRVICEKASNRVVCVIGDGALTGGMAMEAMNHAGHVGTDLTVILNDNEMSIAENVGAMSKYLTRLRTDPSYSRAKAELESILKKLPAIGSKLTKDAWNV